MPDEKIDDPGDPWWLCGTCYVRIKKADNPIGAWRAAKVHLGEFPAHAVSFGFEDGFSVVLTDGIITQVEAANPKLAEAPPSLDRRE